MTDKIISAQKDDQLLDYLLHRRSVPIKDIGAPGPDAEQIKTILKAASRVPDHGKMFPWHFIVFEGDVCIKAGELIAQAFREENPDAAPAKLELEAGRFMRAPAVIAVVSRMRRGKNPFWEQILSAGAACQNLSLAAHALGFGANWLTEWYSYNDTFRKGIGLDERDHIAGLVFIGTPKQQPEERNRPDLDKIVTYWDGGTVLNKGIEYDRENFDFPAEGFDFSRIKS